MLKTDELINWYVRGANKGKASNLKIEGDKLINYETVIAYRMTPNNFMINGEHYSPTTSRIQNLLKKTLESVKKNYNILDTEEEFSENMNNFIKCMEE